MTLVQRPKHSDLPTVLCEISNVQILRVKFACNLKWSFRKLPFVYHYNLNVEICTEMLNLTQGSNAFPFPFTKASFPIVFHPNIILVVFQYYRRILNKLKTYATNYLLFLTLGIPNKILRSFVSLFRLNFRCISLVISLCAFLFT